MELQLQPGKRKKRQQFVVGVLIGLCALLAWNLASSALAQSSGIASQTNPLASQMDEGWHFRYDLFQMLIEERGAEVLPDINRALADPPASLIVITGRVPAQFTKSDWEGLIRFVRDGGNLLVATDSGINVQGFGTFATGAVSVSNPDEQYQGFSDCLLLPIAPTTQAFSPRVKQIVTNRSGWFVPNPISWLNWEVIAALPADCTPQAARSQPVLALGRMSSSEGGIAVVSADASLFSNGMLWHGDNALNAITVSDLLCAGSKQKVVFIADSLVLDSYRNREELSDTGSDQANPEQELPEPELSKALRLANAIAREIAASNVINEALAQQPRPVRSDRYFRVILTLLAVVFFLWMLVLLLKQRIQAFFVRPRAMQPGYEIRNALSSPAGNFQHAAGYLAREFCLELTGSPRAADWQQYLVSRTELNPRDQISSDLAKIIDIACRGCHTKLTRFEFQQLGKSIQSIREKLLASPPLRR